MSRQKKVFALVIGILVAANALFVTCKQPTSSGGKTVRVTGVELDQDLIDDLAVGAVVALKATVKPDNASNKKVTWDSSNLQVVEVDQDGIVTAKALGEDVTITVKTNDGNFTATCIVKVVAGALVSGISLNATELILYEGFDAPLVAIIEPPNAGNKNVIWTTSNANAAIVDEKTGVVTALAEGNATITATSAESGEFTKTCAVVVKKVAGGTPVENITLSPTELTLSPGGATSSLTVTVTPPGAENTVIWHSTNTAVATVAEGTVSSGIAGTAIIYATTKDSGKIALCAVTVRGTPPAPGPGITQVTGVSLNTNSLILNTGETATLTPMVEPSGEPPLGATNKTVNWSTSNRTIATVDSSGKVTAIAAGFAVIIATTADGGYTATCGVTVQTPGPTIIPVTKIELDEHKLTLKMGESSDPLTYKLTPNKPTNENVTWRSNNSAIATVSQNGVVKAEGVGSTSIMVTTVSGGCFDVCDVEVEGVNIAVTAITLKDENGDDVEEGDEITLNKGGTITLISTVLPSDATNKSVTWNSSSVDVATVTGGAVIARDEGETTITVTSVSTPAVKVSFTIIVNDIPTIEVEDVMLALSNLILELGKTATLIPIVLPPEAPSRAVTWSVDDDGVVEVSSSGVVTAVGIGTATVTVETVQNNKTAFCVVTVPDPNDNTPITQVTGVKLDKPGLVLNSIGATATLIATVSPDDATIKGIEWNSTDPSVAKVGEGEGEFEGEVTAIGYGSALIYVTTVSAGKVAVCVVSVQDNSGVPDPTLPSSITLAKDLEEVITGNSVQLQATILPATVSPANKTVTWNSLNRQVATVDSNGLVTTHNAGIAVITAATVNGHMAACQVEVNDPPPTYMAVASVVLPARATVEVDNAITLTPTILPLNATDKAVSWGVAPADIVQITPVSVGGVVVGAEVKGVKAGEATVTVTTNDSQREAKCIITVTQSTDFNIKFDQIAKPDPVITGGYELSTAKGAPALTFTLTNSTQYEEISWKVNAPEITGKDETFTLEGSQFEAYGLGFYFIALEVVMKDDGKTYSTSISFELIEKIEEDE